jgi:hypothetical protein
MSSRKDRSVNQKDISDRSDRFEPSGRERSYRDSRQLRNLLKEVKEQYVDKRIREALKNIPPPPPEEEDEEAVKDLRELNGIFGAYINAFDLRSFWKEFEDLGFHPTTILSAGSGGHTINLSDVSAIHITGKYDGDIMSTSKANSPNFLNQEWEITMREPGVLRVHLKGNGPWNNDFYDINVGKGDIVTAGGSVLNINHLEAKTTEPPKFSPTVTTISP